MSITPTATRRRGSITAPRQRRTTGPTAPPQQHGAAAVRLRSAAIRGRAKDLGWGSVAQMADKFDLSRQQVYKLLNHTYLPKAETAQRMADALEITVDELWEKR